MFLGYERDGGIGTRNHVLILPTVICSSQAAWEIATKVPGTVSVYNQHGCCQIGKDLELTTSTLIGLGKNANVASVLIVALGCEGVSFRKIAHEITRTGKTTELLIIQDEGGTPRTIKKGVKVAKRLVADARTHRRRRFPISELLIGIECGGSDWTSGLASNPAVGYATDKIIKNGGRVVFSETPEIIGAEHLLAKRTTLPAEATKLLKMVDRVESTAKAMGVDLREAQPTPGNIAGGITTIEEKSLGAIHKGGTSLIKGVLEYATPIPKEQGLYFMDSPGQDIESVTGMVAGGAHLITFTTGRGTPTGYPIAPVLKITGNSETFIRMRDNIDLDVGRVIQGRETLRRAGDRIFESVLATATGKLTKAERLHQQEFGIYRLCPSF